MLNLETKTALRAAQGELAQQALELAAGMNVLYHGTPYFNSVRAAGILKPSSKVVRFSRSAHLAEPVHMGDVGIVTNPPYRLAEAFIRKAIADGCHYHAWLLRTNFLESVSRLALWRAHAPSRIWVSSRRLP